MHTIDTALYLRIQQFYYREARLLDERQYEQWLALLSENIVYTVPARHVAQLDNALRETEALLNTQQEFSSGLGPPLRVENYLQLMIRAKRSFKLNAWTENPPARTRRHVSNLEVFVSAENSDEQWQVFSNTLLYYSRHESSNHLYSYQRKDVIQLRDDNFCLLSREVLLDSTVITGPSVGLFF